MMNWIIGCGILMTFNRRREKNRHAQQTTAAPTQLFWSTIRGHWKSKGLVKKNLNVKWGTSQLSKVSKSSVCMLLPSVWCCDFDTLDQFVLCVSVLVFLVRANLCSNESHVVGEPTDFKGSVSTLFSCRWPTNVQQHVAQHLHLRTSGR